MSTEFMPRRKPEDSKGYRIAQEILKEYQPTTKEEINDAIKEIFGPMFEAVLQGEMNSHLGYENNDHNEKETLNRRNGYTKKTLKTTYGDVDINTPRDRDGSFQPLLVPKRTRDVSGIEDKVLAMYARGMSQRDIAATVEDLYGFSISHEQISTITDSIMEEVNGWLSRPLKPFYPFLFVDCLYVTLKKDGCVSQCAIYVILGYDISGNKDVLGLWLSENEGKHNWMAIFDEIKARGVQDVLFISMDGVSGLEEGAKSIFPNVTVQRCIVHLIRNSIKYIPTKDYKPFTDDLKKVYGAPSLKASENEFDKFKEKWKHYNGAVEVWIRNYKHVQQLYNYGSAVRKVMYTTNSIEAVNSSFRKVTKQGAFPNENALFKLLYLRICELYNKWDGHVIQNWSIVLNQLLVHDDFREIIEKYIPLG